MLSELAWNDRAEGCGCLHTSAFGNSADVRAKEASKRMEREHPTVLEASIQVRLDGKEFLKYLHSFCSERLPHILLNVVGDGKQQIPLGFWQGRIDVQESPSVFLYLWGLGGGGLAGNKVLNVRVQCFCKSHGDICGLKAEISFR